jgi:hypothetical protein
LRALIGELPVVLFSQLGEKAYADDFSTCEPFDSEEELYVFDAELRALA